MFRHNVIQDNYYPYAAIDAHGQNLLKHGTRSYEVYCNTVTDGINFRNGRCQGTWALGLRGGDGVVFSNRFSGVWCPIYLTMEGGIKNRKYPVPDQITDLWLWDNVHNGEPLMRTNVGLHDDEKMARYIKKGRDYHFARKPGYKPYTYPHPLRTPESLQPQLPERLPANGNFSSVETIFQKGTT